MGNYELEKESHAMSTTEQELHRIAIYAPNINITVKATKEQVEQILKLVYEIAAQG